MKIKGKYTTAFVTIDELDEGTLNQIHSMVDHPAATNPIAIMPDTHLGKGCVIGFTMELADKVVPNWIGVDIGCGMVTAFTNIDESLFLTMESKLEFDRKVRKVVPMGFNVNNYVSSCFKDGSFIDELNDNIVKFHAKYIKRYGEANTGMLQLFNNERFESYLDKFRGDKGRILRSLGTLGGGNHFIELGIVESTEKLAITVHTGSRNLGKLVCDFHQDKAHQILELDRSFRKHNYIDQLKQSGVSGEELGRKIKEYDKDNPIKNISKHEAFLYGLNVYDYLFDMVVAQTYAKWNRKEIILNILEILGLGIDDVETVESVHNFIDFEDFTIRKGAIRSYNCEKMVIPFNSRDGILICEGKSNKEWNYSAPHGSGRTKSRKKAKQEISKELASEVMSGVFATETPQDESPLCYKDASFIEDAIGPTATIINRIKPLINFKAKD